MKKKIFSISASLLLLTMVVIPADATNVDFTDTDAMLPVDIILDQEKREISVRSLPQYRSVHIAYAAV